MARRIATVTPLRVLDTRDGTGLADRFASGTPRSFQVAGVGTIPDDAIAVTANVTVIRADRQRLRLAHAITDREPDQLDAQLPDR